MTLPHSTEAADEPPPHALLFDDVELHDVEAHAEAVCAEVATKPGCVPLDDAQLQAWISGIVDHDERALLALYEATLSRVYGLVLRLVRRSQLAEEVAEEVYFQVWRQAPRFDAERGRPLTWLLGMARSRAIDAIRRESRFQHEELNEESAPLSAPAAEAAPAPAAVTTDVQGKAVFAYEADDETEVSFAVGDTITNIVEDDSGWWTGDANGKRGMFPANHVQKDGEAAPAAVAAAAAPAATGIQGKVVFDFEASEEGELSLTVGQVVNVLTQDESGWWTGEVDGKTGLFPMNYVEVIEA